MPSRGLFARKLVADIVAAEGAGEPVAKVLGPVSIIAMGIGAIIGAGIFVLTGTAAALYAGPAITLSFVLAAVACALVGLCYAELATLLPVQGSTYTYTYATLGELVAWMIGWDLILEYAVGVAAVACGWSGYFNSLLVTAGLGLPPEFIAGTGQPVMLADGSTVPAIANLPAAAIIVAITLLLVLGTRESMRLNNLMVAVKHGRAALRRIRRGLCERGQLAPFHSGEHRRVGRLRPQWHPARRVDRVLCLYRLRRRVELRAGGAPAAA